MPTDSGGSRSTAGALGSNGLSSQTFATRFSAVAVTNLETTSTNVLWVSTDGSTPAVGGDTASNLGTARKNQTVVLPGQTVVVPNLAPMWYQGQGTSNPGTTVNLAGASAAAQAFLIQGV